MLLQWIQLIEQFYFKIVFCYNFINFFECQAPFDRQRII